MIKAFRSLTILAALVACGGDDSLPPPTRGASLHAPYYLERPELRGTRKPSGQAAALLSATAGICGDNRITGVALAPISGNLAGCGIDEPVKVTYISGVRMIGEPVLNCDMALSMAEYIDRGIKPIVGRRGGGVSSLSIAAGYSCRGRNGQAGAKLSEHATGNAIDISRIGFMDGSDLSILKDWNSSDGELLEALHARACGPFGVVLGPDSDAYHKDHFHFDLSNYGKPYCR